jgi:hypothetical protein
MSKKQRKSPFRGKVAADAHKQKTRASSYGYLNLPKGISIFNEKPGSRINLDFLPYEITDPNHPDKDVEREMAQQGDLWYKRPFKIHRNIGVDNDSVVCLSSIGKKCPICEYRKKLMNQGADKKDTDLLRPQLRNLYIVIPLSKDYDDVPHIWDISQHNFQNLLNEELEEDPDYEVFPDIEEGLTLRVRFDEEVFNKNVYAKASRIDFNTREEQYDESILEDVPNLDEALKIYDYNQLEHLFLDGEIEKSDDTVIDDTPRSRKRHSRQTSTKKADEDAEVVVEEDPEPKRTVKRGMTVRDRENLEVVIAEEEQTKRPVRSRRQKSDDKNRCPNGHVFGEDIDQFDDCEGCEVYDDCDSEYVEKHG